MSKKIKSTTEIIEAKCENCIFWLKKTDGNFGLCNRINVGTDVMIAGRKLQTGKDFLCLYNSPLPVEIVEQSKPDENDNSADNNSAD